MLTLHLLFFTKYVITDCYTQNIDIFILVLYYCMVVECFDTLKFMRYEDSLEKTYQKLNICNS